MTPEERARKIYADLFNGGTIAGIASEIKAAVAEERERCARIAEPVDPVLASVIRKS